MGGEKRQKKARATHNTNSVTKKKKQRICSLKMLDRLWVPMFSRVGGSRPSFRAISFRSLSSQCPQRLLTPQPILSHFKWEPAVFASSSADMSRRYFPITTFSPNRLHQSLLAVPLALADTTLDHVIFDLPSIDSPAVVREAMNRNARIPKKVCRMLPSKVSFSAPLTN